jgi:hypothetical protein
MVGWNDFFVSTAGAASALAGLIFVGVSISLTKILATKSLPDRALISICLLLIILLLSLIFLIPNQSTFPRNGEVVLLSFIGWITVTKIDVNIFREKEKQYKMSYLFNLSFNQIALLSYIVGAIILLLHGDTGIYWIVGGVIVSFFKAVLDAWVLLIEINR